MVFEELKVRFTGEDGLSGILGNITGGMGGASKQGLAMGAAFAVVQMAIQAVMKAIQAMIKFVQESIQAYIKFEKGLAEVSTLLSDTSPLEGYSEGLRQLALDSGESLDTLTKGLYQVISASVDAGAAMDVLTVANRAAIGGLSDTETAVDAITSIMNAYGYSAAEAEQISDHLFTAVKYGKTTFGELAAGIGPVITMAASLGVSFDEVAASIATMTRNGIQTTNAVTYLRGALRSILKPTDQTKEMAKELGITFDATTLKAKGLGGFLEYVADAVGTNTEALSKLFPNIRGIQAVMALAGENADAFAGDLLNMADSAGATDQAFEKMAGTTAFALDRMKARITDIQLEIGEKMVPAQLAMAEVQLALANAVGVLINVLGKLYDMIIGPFVDAFSGAEDALGELMTVFEILGKTVMAIWDATLRPLYTFVAEVLGNAFSLLVDAISIVTDAFNDLFGGLAPGIDIFELFSSVIDGVCNIIKKGVEIAFIPIKVALAVIKTVVEKVIEVFKWLWDLLSPFIDFLASTFKPIIDAISGALNAVGDAVGGFIDWLGNGVDAVSSWADEVLHGKDAVDEFGNSVGRLTDEEITDFAAELAESVRNLEEYDKNIETATNEIKELRKANVDLNEELRKAVRIEEITRSLDDYKRSSTDASYATKIFDDELRVAQTELLKTQSLLDGINETVDEYGDTQKKNNLEISKIRYRARLEGRELTEDEERRINELELANEGLRIKVEEEQIRMDDIEEQTLRNQQNRVDQRILQLKEEKDALKDKSDSEIENLQKEIDANKTAIDEKLAAIGEWNTKRKAEADKLNNDLLRRMKRFHDDELAEISTQSGLKLDEIDDYITDSETKWKNHYSYLSGLSGSGFNIEDTINSPNTITKAEAMVGPMQYGQEHLRPWYYTSSSGKVKQGLGGDYHVGDKVGWAKGGYVPSDLYNQTIHGGEYILPRNIVNLLDSLVSSPATVEADYRRTSSRDMKPMTQTRTQNINIYGNISLPQVQNVDQFMKELQRRSRSAGARL